MLRTHGDGLSAVTVPDGLSFLLGLRRNTSQAGPLRTTSFQYDAAGRRTRITHADGFYVDYDHLVTGEVTKLRENGATSGVGVLATYAYDDRGRRTGLTRGNGTSKSYAYDAVSRLNQMVEDLTGTTGDLTLGFSHNPASQIVENTRSNDSYAWSDHYNLNRSYTSNGLNQYTAVGSVTPTYDAKGNLTSVGSTTYGYSSENLLSSATGSITLKYDPMLRLYETAGGSPGTTRFAYDGVELIAEYNSSNAMLRRYVHGPGVDEPIVWYEGSGTTDRRWLHADERGSIVAASNSAGATVVTNAYDEYGVPKSTNSGRFQYTGQTWLPELGMYYYKARIYSPKLGRFLQTDPIGYSDGMNLYAYVGGDPVNLIDPFGTDIVVVGERPELSLSEQLAILNGSPGNVARGSAGLPPLLFLREQLEQDPEDIVVTGTRPISTSYPGILHAGVPQDSVWEAFKRMLGIGLSDLPQRIDVTDLGTTEGGFVTVWASNGARVMHYTSE